MFIIFFKIDKYMRQWKAYFSCKGNTIFEHCFLSPLAELLSVTSTGQDVAVMSSSSSMQKQAEKDVYIIFIHSLQNGLFRIHIQEYEKTQTK